MKTKAAFVSLVLCMAGCAGTVVEGQPQASYEAAVRNRSMSQAYVNITVINGNDGQSRTTCTTANLLKGAISREYDLASSTAGLEEAEQIALSNKEHTFRFTKPAALANIPDHFTKADLAFIHEKLDGLSVDDLRDGFSYKGNLHAIYLWHPVKETVAYEDAIACVLIERGLSPRMADLTGRIMLAP